MTQAKAAAAMTELWKRIWAFLIVFAVTIIMLEYGMRTSKSILFDGTFYISSPSINNELNETFGWLSPKSRSYEKRDRCYGTGTVSYNEEGFRAPPLVQAEQAGLRICILGDSTMQGYQIPDGQHLPHLLTRQLEDRGLEPYVLPLAVGGFGTTQQWMLFEEYCKLMDPDLLIWHWASNDPTNNSFLADRNSGPNNARPRPYFENGRITMRRPYPIHITDAIDSMMIMKMLNGLILRATAASDAKQQEYREIGWQVADDMVRRVAESVKRRIALVQSNDSRAIEMFERLGFEVAMYAPFPEDNMCKPKDSHPNTKGHQRMLDSLLSVIDPQLAAE